MIQRLFRVYLTQLSHLDAKIASRPEVQLIALNEKSLKSNNSATTNDSWAAYSPFSPKTKTPTKQSSISDLFYLGDRAAVLYLVVEVSTSMWLLLSLLIKLLV